MYGHVCLCINFEFMYVCMRTKSNVLSAYGVDEISFHFLASNE